MADNIVQGMFGVDPNQLRQQQLANMQSQAYQYANLDPMAQGRAGMFLGGAMLGDLGARLMGMQTGEERKAQIRQTALEGIDTSNPNDLATAIKRLSDAGDTQGATALAQSLRQLRGEQSKQLLEQAQAYKARQEPNIEPKNIGTTGGGTPVFADKTGQFTWVNGQRVPFTGKLDMAPSSEGGGMKPGDELRWMNQHSKDYQAAMGVIDSSSDAKSKVQSIVTNPKFGYVFGGYTEKTLAKLAPGEIAGLQGQIDSLKSNLMTAGLNTMRQGGGVGAITEKEWPIFERLVQNLDPKMDEKTARRNLDEINKYFDRAQKRSGEFYQKKWSKKADYYDPSVLSSIDKSNIPEKTTQPSSIAPSAQQIDLVAAAKAELARRKNK